MEKMIRMGRVRMGDERVAVEDGKGNDREWRRRRWRKGGMMMSDGKGSDEERVEWETTKDRGWGLSLDPEGSWVSFNTGSHQQTLFMRLLHSRVIRPEKGIKYK